MITVPGQLVIKTIHGQRGAFNVGRLKTSVYSFTVKDAELDLLEEGVYEGEFVIDHIYVRSYPINSGMAFEIRAVLDRMTLTDAGRLSSDDASSMARAEPDPADEEKAPQPAAIPPSQPTSDPVPAPAELPAAASAEAPAAPAPDTPAAPAADAPAAPSVAGSEDAAKAASEEPRPEDAADAALFGVLWPLGERVKLDTTVQRQLLRQQARRLDQLGYYIDYRTQEFVYDPNKLKHMSEAAGRHAA